MSDSGDCCRALGLSRGVPPWVHEFTSRTTTESSGNIQAPAIYGRDPKVIFELDIRINPEEAIHELLQNYKRYV